MKLVNKKYLEILSICVATIILGITINSYSVDAKEVIKNRQQSRISMITDINGTTITTPESVEVNNEVTVSCIKSNLELLQEDIEKQLIEYEKIQKQLEEERLAKEAQMKRDEECYFNPNNISEPSGISVERAYELLDDTTYQTWDIAQRLVDGEKGEYPVNAIFMISLTRHESWHGKSELANNRNNISSWRLGNGDWRYFNSKYECMDKTINLISDSYLNPDGPYHKGESLWDVGYYYCEGNEWAGYINEMTNYVRANY